ncbi:beta-N-acetylhexosaminidase [Rathayibacter sp. VKM Ac-2927]|uniref:beta-N-acetylhexosaminidase n=1 Tax=Rathayibacter sp. VKM Ac-2927 TaxID=2929478 RepID=UPI001FB50AF2|nr:beta-N-acetylhexosaminidase [Rathayibacter sp. VKM Ac-2927]MCJ1687073.1 beta-N-acetylhexosaminidase [Rathayibacter sp. VKM Ac-2927]
MPSLLPRPRSLRPETGEFVLSASTRIACPEALEGAAQLLRATVGRATGLALERGDEATAGIRLALDPALPPEGYRVRVDARSVALTAAGPAGALHAVQTLLQLLPPAIHRSAPLPGVGWAVPAVTIEDEPRFGWRGMLLDVARHFLPVREVLRVIDLLALHRLTVLHLHLTDDQGWRLEIPRYPRLTEAGAWRRRSQVGAGPTAGQDDRPHGGYYRRDDIREIVAYAAARGVTVVPEIELPGHAQAALAAYPELGVRGLPLETWTEWGVSTNVFNVEESTIEFLEHVLDEVIELFPSAYVHIGGDECPKDQWAADARTQERMRELGVPDENALQSWFVGRIGAHLTRRGRCLLGWDEILEGGLASGATVLSWRGRVGAVAAARAGHDVIACPEDTAYLDHRQSEAASEPIPVSTVTTVADVLAFDPVPPELTGEQARHVLGGQANLWTEHADSPRTLDYLAFPRLCALAEALWSGGHRDTEDFDARLAHHLARLDAFGVEYRRADGPLPWQTRPGVPGRPMTHEEAAEQVALLTADIAGVASGSHLSTGPPPAS